MYTIYSDGILLYTPHLSDAGQGVFSPQLTVELNRAGSLSFTMPPDNVMYDSISKLTSIVTVYQDDEEMFRGRLLNDEKNFYKQKTAYCEGELAFLHDSKQRPYKFEGTRADLFKQYISNHNARVEEVKQFVVGDITLETSNETIAVENDSYPSTFDELTEKLIKPYGGYLKIRGSGDTRYIDWLEESGNYSSQTIEFGVNLLDLEEYISGENVFTVLIPTGKTQTDADGNSAGNLTISSVNDGKDYIEDATAISLFGRIEETESWSDVEDAATLKTLAEAYLANSIELAVTLSVKAVDLSMLDVKWERIRVGDWVQVISIPHELDKWFQCTKIIYDLIDPEKSEYTFGVDYTSFTGKQVNGEKSIQNSVALVKTSANNAAAQSSAANSSVTTLNNTLNNEYVKASTFESYKTEVNARLSKLEGGTS